jgi:hypothetical protein
VAELTIAVTVPQQPLVSGLIALQFIAFGWRINREITVGDQQRRTWIPTPDLLNLISLLAVVLFCVALPLGLGVVRAASAVLSAGYALIAFHPISEAAHYRLFSKRGRSIYLESPGSDYRWITDQEIATVALSLVCAATAAAMAWCASK